MPADAECSSRMSSSDLSVVSCTHLRIQHHWIVHGALVRAACAPCCAAEQVQRSGLRGRCTPHGASTALLMVCRPHCTAASPPRALEQRPAPVVAKRARKPQPSSGTCAAPQPCQLPCSLPSFSSHTAFFSALHHEAAATRHAAARCCSAAAAARFTPQWPLAYFSVCSRRRRMVDRTVTDAAVLQGG